METTKCFICGRELPMDMTQLIISEGKHKYESCCMSHEGSKAVADYIKS